MTPEIDTYSHYIREKVAQLNAVLEGLSDDDLNRAPDLPGANSPYVIVTHVLGNMRAWVLGIICGQDLHRDRPAEFRSTGTRDEIDLAARSLSREMESALQKLDPIMLSDRFIPPQELWGEGDPVELERRACLAHVLEHAGIHLGHLHMTLELPRR
jgi:uncharacterized damage-inducible protein DinB